MRYLKHKTVDLIYRHDYTRPLQLFGGYSDEFEALVNAVQHAAYTNKCRLRITFRKFNSVVTISKVV